MYKCRKDVSFIWCASIFQSTRNTRHRWAPQSKTILNNLKSCVIIAIPPVSNRIGIDNLVAGALEIIVVMQMIGFRVSHYKYSGNIEILSYTDWTKQMLEYVDVDNILWNRRVTQIHNAPFCNRNMHLWAHFVTKWCTFEYSSNALWNLWDRSILARGDTLRLNF